MLDYFTAMILLGMQISLLLQYANRAKAVLRKAPVRSKNRTQI